MKSTHESANDPAALDHAGAAPSPYEVTTMSSLPAAKRSHPALANALYPLVNEWGAGAVLRALADCIEAQAPDYDHDVEAKQACKRTIALANWMDFNL